MSEKQNSGVYKELMNTKLNDILAMIAFKMDEDGATKGDAGRLVIDNKYYEFSVIVVKKEV